jgi:hypothetical protein
VLELPLLAPGPGPAALVHNKTARLELERRLALSDFKLNSIAAHAWLIRCYGDPWDLKSEI